MPLRQAQVESGAAAVTGSGFEINDAIVALSDSLADAQPEPSTAAAAAVGGIGLDEAFEMAKVLASRGVFVGQSSGAYLVAAVEAAKADRDARVVTIFNDLGERYFSTGMWD